MTDPYGLVIGEIEGDPVGDLLPDRIRSNHHHTGHPGSVTEAVTNRCSRPARLELVKNTLTTYSALDDDAAGKTPHVLHALNSIPREGALSSTPLTRRLPRPYTRGIPRSTASHNVSLSSRELDNPGLAFVAEHFAFR